MAVPHTYDDYLRIHDAAFYNWLGTLLVDYGDVAGVTRNQQPILRVMTTPQRAMAEVVDFLVSQGWIEGTDAADMRKKAEQNFTVLPMPFCSFLREEPQLDPQLQGAVKTIRRRFFNCDIGQWEYHPWPKHHRIGYNVTFRSHKKFTDAYMREFIYGQLGGKGKNENETYIPVVHKAPAR